MDEAFSEAVLQLVESVRPGRVVTYGLIADRLGRAGPRQVGAVMSRDGHSVPWWRCVRANGSLPAYLMIEAQQHWLEEGTPVRNGRVDLVKAIDPALLADGL